MFTLSSSWSCTLTRFLVSVRKYLLDNFFSLSTFCFGRRNTAKRRICRGFSIKILLHWEVEKCPFVGYLEVFAVERRFCREKIIKKSVLHFSVLCLEVAAIKGSAVIFFCDGSCQTKACPQSGTKYLGKIFNIYSL